MTADDLRKRLADNPDLAKLNGDVNPDRELEEIGRQVVIKQDWDRPSKYGSVRTTVDDVTFDSKRESQRYLELKTLERAGEILNLELQPSYELVVNGQKIGTYKADFRYIDNEGNTIVEDVKGVRTDVYKLKRKLMMAIHGIEIEEME
jgi:hypothetical protein